MPKQVKAYITIIYSINPNGEMSGFVYLTFVIGHSKDHFMVKN